MSANTYNPNSLGSFTFQQPNELYSNEVSDIAGNKAQIAVGNVEGMIPAIVQSYDYNTNRVVVKIAINRVSNQTDNNGNREIQERALIQTTVLQPFGNLSSGGIGIIFPLKQGDRGWLEASDRDTNSFKNATDKSVPYSPTTLSNSRYTFGKFIPDVINGVVVAPSDKGCFLITNLNGGTKISVSPDGSMNVSMPTNTTYTTPTFTINGNLFVTGDVVAGTNQKISLTTHTHGGVQGGTSNTSTPNPQ